MLFCNSLSLSAELLCFTMFSSSMFSTIVSRALRDKELAVRRLWTENAF